VKEMLGITYKTRNENEKHENGKTKKDTTFRPWSARQAILETFCPSLYHCTWIK